MILGSNRTNAPYLVPTAALAAILCASCAGPFDQTDEQRGERYNGNYTCRGLGQVELRFYDSMGIADVTRQGRTFRLRQQRSGEVAIYSDGPHSLRRSGKDISLELVSGEPSRCVPSSGPG
jgi:hypothetical protein